MSEKSSVGAADLNHVPELFHWTSAVVVVGSVIGGVQRRDDRGSALRDPFS